MSDVSEAGHITDPATGRNGACAAVAIDGKILTLVSSIDFPLSACLKVEQGNSMWMGEVWACEPVADGFRIEIEATVVIEDVEAVDRLATHFRHERPRRTSIKTASKIV